MDRIIDKSAAQRGAIEKILHFIPGFRGYLDKEWRREADKLEREFVASKLSENKAVLKEATVSLSRSGGLEAMTDLDRVDKKLDKIIQRIRFANYGASGFFDTVKVGEAELDRVYAFDLALLEGAQGIAARAAAVKAAPDAAAAKGAVSALLEELEAMDRAFNEREQCLRR
ncbi:MAG: hypothetical protein HYY93_05845 [Planctomycetes bacterium]|nr:hypothetical protein [Planctomycetota bacterium]